MAIELDHIRLANRNHQLLTHLLQIGGYPDWVATVAFYKAVHVVEALFAANMGRHSISHADREATLKTAIFKNVWKDYSHLATASRVARYLEASNAGVFSNFADFMGEEDVKRLVRKRLFGVEQRSLAFLSDPARNALMKVDPATV